jgi:hypothetical protein
MDYRETARCAPPLTPVIFRMGAAHFDFAQGRLARRPSLHNEVKGGGQECLPHTGEEKGRRGRCLRPFVFVRNYSSFRYPGMPRRGRADPSLPLEFRQNVPRTLLDSSNLTKLLSPCFV